jgi:hypothetical protein
VYTSWKHYPTAVAMFVFANPFLALIRNAGFDSIVLSGWREIVIVIIFSIGVAKSSLRFKKHYFIILSTTVILLFYLLFHIFYAKSPIIGLLGFRENGMILLIIPIILFFMVKGKNELEYILKALFIGSVIVSLFDITNYYYPISWINVDVSRTIMGERSIFNQSAQRLTGYFGVGPSGVAAYYSNIAIGVFVYLLKNRLSLFYRLFWVLSMFILLFASMLTISLTTYSVIIIGISSFYLLTTDRKNGLRNIFIGVPATALILNLGLIYAFDINMVEILSSMTYRFSTQFFPLITWPMNIKTWVLGYGYSIRTGRLLGGVGDYGEYVTDTGWFGLLTQFGLTGTLLYILLILVTFLGISRLKKNNFYSDWIFMVAAAMFFASFGYVHGAAISQKPLDIIFVLMVCIISATRSKYSSELNSNDNH